MKKWLLIFLVVYSYSSDQEAPPPEEFEWEEEQLETPIYSETSKYFFSPDEYNFIMQLIEEIDPQIHALLLECSAGIGEPCIQKTYYSAGFIKNFDDATRQNPILLLSHTFLKHSKEEQKKILKHYLKEYPYKAPIEYAEQIILLKAIEAVAPELYNIIIAKDPSGKDHIKRFYEDYNLAVNISPHDGLPVIYVGARFWERLLSFDQIKASIAHELGHYVSGHILPFIHNTTKILVNARMRVQEYEADRAQVLDFDIPIEIALNTANTLLHSSPELKLTDADRRRKTFTKTHPFWTDRLEHFASLQREVELKKIHGQGRTIFDWQTLAQKHKAALNEHKKSPQ